MLGRIGQLHSWESIRWYFPAYDDAGMVLWVPRDYGKVLVVTKVRTHNAFLVGIIHQQLHVPTESLATGEGELLFIWKIVE